MIRKQIEHFARYGGFLAMALEWFALLFFYLSQPALFNGQYAISHFATLPQTRLVFSFCYALAALSFWIFAKYHLSKHYRTPITVFSVSMLGFAAMAIIPFDPNNLMSNAAHHVLAFILFLGLLAGIYMMGHYNHDKLLKKVSIASIVLSAGLLVGFIFVPNGSHMVLVFEAGAAFMCQLWILWVSFYVYKR